MGKKYKRTRGKNKPKLVPIETTAVPGKDAKTGGNKMRYIYLKSPLGGDIQAYIDDIEKEWISSNMSDKEYYVSLGKALAYTEAQYSINMITKEETQDLLDQIEELLTE